MENEDNMPLVKAAEFSDVNTAHIVEQMLIANGVQATVMGDVSPYPVITLNFPVKLMVLEKDLEKALALIEQNAG